MLSIWIHWHWNRLKPGTAETPDEYQHLISYGMQLQAIDEIYKTDQYNISGCQSHLWIVSERMNGKIIFHAESD